MRRFSVVEADAARSNKMRIMQVWIRKFICVVKAQQLVVGNRIDHLTNQPVTEEMFDLKDRAAHVCPFVQTSIDRDQYWLEESDLTNDDQQGIEDLLRKQLRDFLATEPAYDPMGTGSPVPASEEYIYKTFMTVFPNVIHDRGRFPLFDIIHANLKPTFLHHGLMLGQFYHSCPYEEGAIYAPDFKSVILSSPTPAFAMRYLVSQDKIFNLLGSEQVQTAHQRYFPDA